MVNKEVVTKRILDYINQTWELRNLNNLSPLVKLMIENIGNELYLLSNKLEDLDISVANKLVSALAPDQFHYARPAHTIIQLYTPEPTYTISHHTSFSQKEIGKKKSENEEAFSYLPVVDVNYHKVDIFIRCGHRFIWEIKDRYMHKMYEANSRMPHNVMWFGFQTDANFDKLPSMPIYLSFPHLPDDHPYYDQLGQVKWYYNDKLIKVKQGFPIVDDTSLYSIDKEIIHYYDDHYFNLPSLELFGSQPSKLPLEIIDYFDKEVLSNLSRMRWLRLEFPYNFKDTDIDQLMLYFNTVPIVNKTVVSVTKTADELKNPILLNGIYNKEQFLHMAKVIDDLGNEYHIGNNINNKYTYTLENNFHEDDSKDVLGHLERLADLLARERAVFPQINNEQLLETLQEITELSNQNSNQLIDSQMDTILHLNLEENAKMVDISFYTTALGEESLVDANVTLMSGKDQLLSKVPSFCIRDSIPGRDFSSITNLKSINNFHISAKDRIITKYNIISFCKLEVGEFASYIDVEHKVIASPQIKHGMINVMEISITPKASFQDYFKSDFAIKDLLIRLRQKSPSHYNYQVKIVEL